MKTRSEAERQPSKCGVFGIFFMLSAGKSRRKKKKKTQKKKKRRAREKEGEETNFYSSKAEYLF